MRLSFGRAQLVGLVAIALAAAGLLVAPSTGHRQPQSPTSAGTDSTLPILEAVLARDGLAAALDSLDRRAARDSALLRNGHQIAHTLGRDAVARAGGDASVIRMCRPSLASGCYHGVVEAAVGTGRRVDMPKLERLCLGMDGPGGPAPAFECLRGVGHGVLGTVGHDVAAALAYCEELSAPRRAASCRSGAFMEAITGAMGPPMTHDMHAAAPGGARGHIPPFTINAADTAYVRLCRKAAELEVATVRP